MGSGIDRSSYRFSVAELLQLKHCGMPTAGLPLSATLDNYNRLAWLHHRHAQ